MRVSNNTYHSTCCQFNNANFDRDVADRRKSRRLHHPSSANDAMTPPPRRSSRLNKPTGVAVTNTRDDRTLSTTVTQQPTSQDKQYQSAIAQHLYVKSDCSDVYSDDCFVGLSRGRSRRHLQVLQSIYIHTQRPNLCKQKQNVAALLLFKSSISPI